jgi:ATPase subunit of ABC transporter with duplicated ATPase domains
MLIRALADYEGTLLLVSHDRRFLSALTNRVLELEADGPRVYPGGYAEYVDGERTRGARHEERFVTSVHGSAAPARGAARRRAAGRRRFGARVVARRARAAGEDARLPGGRARDAAARPSSIRVRW